MFYVGADRHYIDELPYNSLASLRCALYLECSTAVSLQMERTVNLLSATFDKGAHFVLGTTDTVFTNNSDLNEIDVPDGEYTVYTVIFTNYTTSVVRANGRSYISYTSVMTAETHYCVRGKGGVKIVYGPFVFR